jgi:hypothetical protein
LPGAVIHRPALGGWHPRMPERLDEGELAEGRAGRDAGLSARRAGGSARGSESLTHNIEFLENCLYPLLAEAPSFLRAARVSAVLLLRLSGHVTGHFN